MKVKSIIQIFAFAFLCFQLLSASEQPNIYQIGFQAEALWEARDYAGAEALYEKLVSQPLPAWQQARLQYNLGSIQLARLQTTDAIQILQKINPADLSLPHFGRDLLLNKGISYLQYAQTLTPNSPFFDQKRLFIEQSIIELNNAQALGCKLQQMEEEREGFTCSPHALIEQWTKSALSQLDEMNHQNAQKWMDETSIESLATYLSILLQQLISEVKPLQEQNNNLESLNQRMVYLQHQTESLAPLWDSLKKRSFSPSELLSFDDAAKAYLNSIAAFTQKNFSSGLTSLENAFEKLGALSFKDHIDLRLAILNYEILLYQPTLSTGDLEGVQWEVDQLKGENNQTQTLDLIKHYLQIGLNALKEKKILQARFSLLAGFGRLSSLLPSQEQSPLSSLQQALGQASRSFQLLTLSQLMQPSKEADSQEMLIIQQEAVLTLANTFIPAVLKEQSIRYHEAKSPDAGCQQSPWDQAIPLFDHGYLAAQNAAKLSSTSSPQRSDIAAYQEQTIQDWMQALALIKNPPQKSPAGGNSTSSKGASPRNLAETFRLIQEMYLEDQAPPEPENKELHSW